MRGSKPEDVVAWLNRTSKKENTFMFRNFTDRKIEPLRYYHNHGYEFTVKSIEITDNFQKLFKDDISVDIALSLLLEIRCPTFV